MPRIGRGLASMLLPLVFAVFVAACSTSTDSTTTTTSEPTTTTTTAPTTTTTTSSPPTTTTSSPPADTLDDFELASAAVLTVEELPNQLSSLVSAYRGLIQTYSWYYENSEWETCCEIFTPPPGTDGAGDTTNVGTALSCLRAISKRGTGSTTV